MDLARVQISIGDRSALGSGGASAVERKVTYDTILVLAMKELILWLIKDTGKNCFVPPSGGRSAMATLKFIRGRRIFSMPYESVPLCVESLDSGKPNQELKVPWKPWITWARP
jgi:hypothetical protein